MLVSSAVDRGLEPQLGQRTDHKIDICCFSVKQSFQYIDQFSNWRHSTDSTGLYSCSKPPNSSIHHEFASLISQLRYDQIPHVDWCRWNAINKIWKTINQQFSNWSFKWTEILIKCLVNWQCLLISDIDIWYIHVI